MAKKNGSAPVAMVGDLPIDIATGRPPEVDNGQGDDAQWAKFEAALKVWKPIRAKALRDADFAQTIARAFNQGTEAIELAECGNVKEATFKLWEAIKFANRLDFEENFPPIVEEILEQLDRARQIAQSLSKGVRSKLNEVEDLLDQASDDKLPNFRRMAAVRKARWLVYSARDQYRTEEDEKARARNASKISRVLGTQPKADSRDAAAAVQADIAARTLAGHTNGREATEGDGRPKKGGKGKGDQNGRPTPRERGGANGKLADQAAAALAAMKNGQAV